MLTKDEVQSVINILAESCEDEGHRRLFLSMTQHLAGVSVLENCYRAVKALQLSDEYSQTTVLKEMDIRD